MTISAQTFDEHKRVLWGMCYRMIGSATDADDIVQDTFVKALERPPTDMEAPLRPWLVKVAMNLSRDHLRRRRRREYVGPWLPSPVLTDGDDQNHPGSTEASPGVRYDMMESLTLAFLLALETLTPAQRAVLLLRDVFDYSTTETADALDMSEANIKVTLHRARRIMGSYEKNRVSNFSRRVESMRDTLQQFLSRLASGDVQGLKEMLAADVVLVTDGGGEINALADPVYGSEKVLRLIAKLYEANRDVTSTSLRNVNGEPAILVERSQMRPGHASFFTMHCELDADSRMQRLHFVFAPSKLTALTSLP
ncbi:MAG TPA: sigma-70 family RNA polymerase sigma factor [Pyrinomonadaceae bacterium]|nr:sigma-70 family RNA polymerase sigma factor [Pyrinomonadaceae bacterium]